MNLKLNEITDAWSTPLYLAKPDIDQSINVQLAEIILDREKKFSSEHVAQSENRLFFNEFSLLRTSQMLFEWDYECIKKIHNLITEHAAKYIENTYAECIGKTTTKAWANVHSIAEWHGPHSHFTGGSEIASGVYWVRIPAPEDDNNDYGGQLVLFDPRGPFFPERKKIIVKPSSGQLIIFPSWLQHVVTPWKSKESRIAIGFDIQKNI